MNAVYVRGGGIPVADIFKGAREEKNLATNYGRKLTETIFMINFTTSYGRFFFKSRQTLKSCTVLS